MDLAVLGVGVDVDDLLPGGGQAGQEGGGQVQAVHRAGGASCQGDQGGVDVLVKDVCRWEDEKSSWTTGGKMDQHGDDARVFPGGEVGWPVEERRHSQTSLGYP